MPFDFARYIYLKAWLRQRTRWMKGFLQTSITHGRRPLTTFRRLGRLETLCAATMLPGALLSALGYPVFLLWAAADFLLREIPAAPSCDGQNRMAQSRIAGLGGSGWDQANLALSL